MIESLLPPQIRPIVAGASEEPLLLESSSALMSEFIGAARRAALADAPILLDGETGTGKSAFARQIHRWGPRREAPFLVIDCVALSERVHEGDPFENLRNSLAFVHGAHPKQSDVSAATLFLDNIADLSPAAQTKLLRFVEAHQSIAHSSSPSNVRIIAASSRDLSVDVCARRFRSDLFYRINVIALQIPALIDRRRDIPVLAEHLLARAALRNNRLGLRLSDEAASAITGYHWPGNVRELRNAIERAAVLCTSDVITEGYLVDAIRCAGRRRSLPDSVPLISLDEIESRHIRHVLKASSNMREAAAVLGIDCSTLWRKRKLYNIE